MVLRAACAIPNSPDAPISIDGIVTNPLAAFTLLAALPKPVVLRAVNHENRLTITSEQVSGAKKHSCDWRKTSPIMAAPTLGSDDFIVLTGAHESERLSSTCFNAFLSDYVLDVPLSIAGDWPSQEQARDGAVWVLTVSASDLEDDTPVPAEVQHILNEITKVRGRNAPR